MCLATSHGIPEKICPYFLSSTVMSYLFFVDLPFANLFRRAIPFFIPGKGLRYLWTIIVIADVHWCFIQWAIILRLSLPNLTFQHWSGLTPYTSSCELAVSCVFDKQSVERRLLQPAHRAKRDARDLNI